MTVPDEATPEQAKKIMLRTLRRDASRADTAVDQRDRAIRMAHRHAGLSLREIAEATGINHMTIKRIIDRQPAEDE